MEKLFEVRCIETKGTSWFNADVWKTQYLHFGRRYWVTSVGDNHYYIQSKKGKSIGWQKKEKFEPLMSKNGKTGV